MLGCQREFSEGNVFGSEMMAVVYSQAMSVQFGYALRPAVQAATSRLGKMIFGRSRHGCIDTRGTLRWEIGRTLTMMDAVGKRV